MLRKIYQELVAIKKELQAIHESVEFLHKNFLPKNFNTKPLGKKELDLFIHPIRLTSNSLARQLRPEQNGE